MSASHQDAWFIGEPPAGAVPVFCFVHAGGNPRSFLPWQDSLAPGGAIIAVAMPGRAHRFAEPRPQTIDEYADGAARAIGERVGAGPFVLFGHSLGALVAFEVARRLAGSPGLRRLVASGASAPKLLPSKRVVAAAALEGRAFAEAVGFFGGLPPEVVANDDLRDLLLPGVQADFRLVASYRYAPAPRLPVGITLVNGEDDPHIGPSALDGWADETTAGVARHWSPGGHFYFEDHPHAIADVLREVLATTSGHAELTI